MIGQHPALFGLPELKLFLYPTIGELAASLPSYARARGIVHRSPGLVRALAEVHFGGQTPETVAAALNWLDDRADWSGEQVLDLIIKRVSPRHVVEKSPDHLVEPSALPRLAKAYPRARYIHLTRHPVTTITSMHQYLGRTLPGYRDGDFASYCIKSWLETHQRIVKFTRRLPSERWFRLNAEQLLNDPEPQLTALATWLEVSADPPAIHAMSHPERSPFARFAPASSGVPGGNDPEFLADPYPHRVEVPTSLTPPVGWSPDPSLWSRVIDAGDELGY
jgi:Sulfotransferase family